ncbi:hypothetical protein J4210_01890 [Candidatus Woesearchaeota archaeon]|nr:hypothetical protein [Candidatus Woesearchaeota archaeon]
MTTKKYWTDSVLEDYLSSFLGEHPCAAVSEIVYCRTEEHCGRALQQHLPKYAWNSDRVGLFWVMRQHTSTVATTMFDQKTMGAGTPTAIFVYPAALFVPADELVSIIRDHEYVHASDWCGGIPIDHQRRITIQNKDRLIPETINAIMEVRAYGHQLEAMPLEWAERPIFENASSNYSRNYQFLKSRLAAEDSSRFERNILRDFLKNAQFLPTNL